MPNQDWHNSLSRRERAQRAKLASNARWAKIPDPADRSAETDVMRQGWLNKLADEIDPEHKLSDENRMAAAKQLRKAHMAKITLKSLASRKRKRDAAH
jgi:hypothetical protein